MSGVIASWGKDKSVIMVVVTKYKPWLMSARWEKLARPVLHPARSVRHGATGLQVSSGMAGVRRERALGPNRAQERGSPDSGSMDSCKLRDRMCCGRIFAFMCFLGP